MPTKKNRTAYFRNRQKTLYKRYAIYFNLEKDKDIIEALNSCKSKPDYIRKLIREDLKK